MAGTSDLNIVLNQGSSVREAQNIRKQNLDLNQQFVAQNTEKENKAQQSRVRDSETRNRMEADGNKEKDKQKDPQKQRSKKDPEKEDPSSSEGNIIDITV